MHKDDEEIKNDDLKKNHKTIKEIHKDDKKFKIIIKSCQSCFNIRETKSPK